MDHSMDLTTVLQMGCWLVFLKDLSMDLATILQMGYW
jgi:hypothetical protein